MYCVDISQWYRDELTIFQGKVLSRCMSEGTGDVDPSPRHWEAFLVWQHLSVAQSIAWSMIYMSIPCVSTVDGKTYSMWPVDVEAYSNLLISGCVRTAVKVDVGQASGTYINVHLPEISKSE